MYGIEETKRLLNTAPFLQTIEIENLIYGISQMLDDRTEAEISTLCDQVLSSVERYFDIKLDEEIERLRGFLHSSDSKAREYASYFFEADYNKYEGGTYHPIPDLIIEEFETPNSENTPLYYALDDCLTDKYTYEVLENWQDYECFAALALIYTNCALSTGSEEYIDVSFDDAKEVFSKLEIVRMLEVSSLQTITKALITIGYAKENKARASLSHKLRVLEFEIKKKDQSIEKIADDVKRQHSIKALNKRHETNRKKKQECIADWRSYQSELMKRGKTASKNAFSLLAQDKYNMAYTTIRDNWLKGI